MSPDPLSPAEAQSIVAAAERLTSAAIARVGEITQCGGKMDEHQVAAERVAYAATETRAARALVDLAAARTDAALTRIAGSGAAQLAWSARDRLMAVGDELTMAESDLERAYPDDVRALIRRAATPAALQAIGRHVAQARGRHDVSLNDFLDQVRHSVRQFADNEIAPHAERIHRGDELVPEEFIAKMAELGYFGLSVPEAYGGHEVGNLAMILTTEELSRASLAAAGSLITRPEILTKALLAGGSEAQKKTWLPRIASGELMVAIAVTEPDSGSDVASIACRAERVAVAGRPGWALSGAKSWCTFAGRADVLALLARTDPDPGKGANGLSLFIVPKPAFPGRAFEVTQPGGGRLEGRADATPGYRGMHSFGLTLDHYFVPADHLVGEEQGEGRGFRLQMAGFAAGRLQTGGRACGLAQAAVEKTAAYVVERSQFGRPIIEFQLTQYQLGLMATKLACARAITYAAAEAMDRDERGAAPLAAQAKLFSCDVAVEVTQMGQLLHGGWGYAEEYPISRYVIDALVLPIFEGVKPILELKVVARSLLSQA